MSWPSTDRDPCARVNMSEKSYRDAIRDAPARHGIVACPHTATGLKLLEDLRASGDARPWAVVATAHPAKFEGIVEPLVGHPVQLPAALAECLARPATSSRLANDYGALRTLLAG